MRARIDERGSFGKLHIKHVFGSMSPMQAGQGAGKITFNGASYQGFMRSMAHFVKPS